jgi:PST family polysaccharide transporter
MSELLKYYSAFKEKYIHSDRKSLFQNFIALFILQVSNYALPLIVLPFLTRILLPEGYGELAWSQYVVQFLIMITDFGFNFSATRQISIHQNDKERIARIFTAVMMIKFILLLFSCFLVYTWIQIAEFDFLQSTLLWVSVLSVAGNVFFPVWFFQGMEKMKWITIINVLFKLIYAVFIFLLVKDASDVIPAAFILAICNFAAGITAFIFVFRNFQLRWMKIQRSEIFYQFKDGWFIFISTFFTSVYVYGNGFILHGYWGDETVGYFNPAEKIVRAVTSFFNPVLLAFYPYISKKFDNDKKAGEALFFSSLKKVSVITFFSSILLFVFADTLSDFIGEKYDSSAEVIRWLAVIPFFGVAGAMLSYQLFLNIGLSGLLPWLLFALMSLDLILCYLLIPEYKEVGAAMALCITEISAPVLYLIVYFSKRKNLYAN